MRVLQDHRILVLICIGRGTTVRILVAVVSASPRRQLKQESIVLDGDLP